MYEDLKEEPGKTSAPYGVNGKMSCTLFYDVSSSPTVECKLHVRNGEAFTNILF
jgi:hypothetical protein